MMDEQSKPKELIDVGPKPSLEEKEMALFERQVVALEEGVVALHLIEMAVNSLRDALKREFGLRRQ